MVPLAHPSPQRYGITKQTWCIIILYRHVCTVTTRRFIWYLNITLYGTMTSHHIILRCLHSYTITFYWLHGCRVLTGVEIRYSTYCLGPTRVHNPNGMSIGSAVFAQLTAECRRPLKIAPYCEGIWIPI